MHARSIHSSPKQLPILGIRGQLVAQYVLSLYILAILTIITYVTWLVYLQKNTRYISTSGPFVLAHTNGPHVSYATRITHMQFPTYTYITTQYIDGTQMFDAEWAALLMS